MLLVCTGVEGQRHCVAQRKPINEVIGQTGASGGCPSSRSVVQMSPCPGRSGAERESGTPGVPGRARSWIAPILAIYPVTAVQVLWGKR